MHGDVVATVDDDVWAASTNTYFEQTEYGTPRTGNTANPERYGWLGTTQRSADNLADVLLMGVRLYNSNTGRFLSADQIVGAGENSYTYPNDPINRSDVSGKRPDDGGVQRHRARRWVKPQAYARATGKSVKAVLDAIHKEKLDALHGGARKNPDVEVDLNSGDVKVKGASDESIFGNVDMTMAYMRASRHSNAWLRKAAAALGVGAVVFGAVVWIGGVAFSPMGVAIA